MFELIIVVWLTALTHEVHGIECERTGFGPNQINHHCEKK